jgi:hypothetical protein
MTIVAAIFVPVVLIHQPELPVFAAYEISPNATIKPLPAMGVWAVLSPKHPNFHPLDTERRCAGYS